MTGLLINRQKFWTISPAPLGYAIARKMRPPSVAKNSP